MCGLTFKVLTRRIHVYNPNFEDADRKYCSIASHVNEAKTMKYMGVFYVRYTYIERRASIRPFIQSIQNPKTLS